MVDQQKNDRETPYESWGAPESLADFLYELRFRLKDEKRIAIPSETDFTTLYDYLKLDGVVSRRDFHSLMEMEREPSKPLLEHIRTFLSAHHSRSAIEIYDQVAAKHLAHHDALIVHPYRLAGLLDQRIGRSSAACYRVSADLGVYPALLEAIRSGEALASPALRQKICDYFKVDADEAARIKSNSADYMQQMQQQSPEKALQMRVLGATTRESALVETLENLLYPGSPFSVEGLHQQMGYKPSQEPSALMRVLADARVPSKTLMRRNYAAEVVHPLADALALSPTQRKVLMAVGTRRPLGELLEEYVFSGGKSWPGFWQTVEQDWNVGSQTIAEEVGVSRAQLFQWMNRDPAEKKKVDLRSIDRIADQAELNKVQRDCLQALGSGDLTVGADFAETVQQMQRQMKQLPDIPAREAYARECFQHLLKRSGKTPAEVSRAVGGFEDGIYSQNKGEGRFQHTWILAADSVAKTLCPYRSHTLRRDTALLLLGIPEYRTPSAMLEDVLNGGMRAGEMVYEYRLQHGMGSLEFSKLLGSDYNETLYKRAEHAPVEEKGQRPSMGLLEDIAKHMNLNDDETRLFIAAARDKPVMRQGTALKVLEKALAGEASFADLINAVLREKYGHRAVKGTEGAALLGKDLGVSHDTVINWQQGGRVVHALPVIEKLADIVGVPEYQREAFQPLATGKYEAPSTSLQESINHLGKGVAPSQIGVVARP